MAIFIWDDSYKTGVESIDLQHKKLVDLLNQLDENLAIDGNKKQVISLLDELVEYTQYHFKEEESYMLSHEYDNKSYKEHLTVHQQFIEKIKQAQKDCHINPDKVTDELLDFLVQWLINHILLTDKQMVSDISGDGFIKSDHHQSNIDILQNNLYGALRESESRFKELADILPALIWINNVEGKRIFVNKQFSLMTGLLVADCGNAKWSKVVHAEDIDALHATYEQVKKTGKPLEAEYRLLQKNGEDVWVLETIVPRFRKSGKISGFMGCGIDITKQKKIEKSLEETVEKRTLQLQKTNQILEKEKEDQVALNSQLKETQGHLIQSEKMASIGQLAAGVAHEINNPLGYIYSNLNTLKSYLTDLEQIALLAEKMSAELTEDNSLAKEFNQLCKDLDLEFLQEDLQDLVKESIEGATRAKKIVQDLRDFSRIDKQESEIFDVEEGLNTTLNIVHNELKYKADIVKEFGGIKPFECVGAQLNQVFMNLLVNAAHSIDDFGKITVRTGYQDKDYVWIEVEDTGKGIPEDIKNKIFDPFFTTKPVGKGTGLGLSLSYKIIQDHQGKIELDSVVGKGTRFRVYFPINKNK
ncbi:MAG: bacteriohemerythrin [Methylococcaceae bacterium]|nr:bacteriohemerythrin [Methylococcaceae bacterium]